MIRWLLCILVGLISVFATLRGWSLLSDAFTADARIVVLSEGSWVTLQVGNVVILKGDARPVELTRMMLGFLVFWYAVSAALALAGVWLLASGPARPRRIGREEEDREPRPQMTSPVPTS
jgi:hypothetical protein